MSYLVRKDFVTRFKIQVMPKTFMIIVERDDFWILFVSGSIM